MFVGVILLNLFVSFISNTKDGIQFAKNVGIREILFILLDNALSLDYENSWITFSKMYTPFFAGIASVYALHKNSKSSFKQAKIRTLGSVIGGYFGMIIILICESILINALNLYETNYILY